MSHFQIRDARLSDGDVEFVTAAFDSTLSYLASIGSGEMWGTTLFSEKPGFADETRESIEQSETYCATGQGEKVRVYIAEVQVGEVGDLPADIHTRVTDDGKTWHSVAAAVVHDNWVPSYINSQPHLGLSTPKSDSEQLGHDHSYLEVMIADWRTGQHHRGAGVALIKAISERCKKQGSCVLYVDGWGGNGRKLIRYYEKHGFKAVGDFEIKRANGTIWLGTLLKLAL